ncbi:hypothetical protein [Rhodobacter sp. NSM]
MRLSIKLKLAGSFLAVLLASGGAQMGALRNLCHGRAERHRLPGRPRPT